jgi:hypothetical protein
MLEKINLEVTRAAGSIRRAITAVALAAALLLPATGQATVIADPDLLDDLTYPVGSVINDAFDGLTLSSGGNPAPFFQFPGDVLRDTRLGAVVTDTLGYNHVYTEYGYSVGSDDIWGAAFYGQLILRVELDQPANYVFADIISFGHSSDIMQIRAYDASGGHLGTSYGQDFPYATPTPVEYSQPELTIASFIVTNYDLSFGFVIDRVGATVVPEPTTALLLAAGLAGLAAAGRRRSHH